MSGEKAETAVQPLSELRHTNNNPLLLNVMEVVLFVTRHYWQQLTDTKYITVCNVTYAHFWFVILQNYKLFVGEETIIKIIRIILQGSHGFSACLTSMRTFLSLIPRAHLKNKVPYMVVQSHNANTGEAETRGPWPCWAASLAYLAISNRTHSNQRLYFKREKQMVSIEGMRRLSSECICINSNTHNCFVVYTPCGTNRSEQSCSLRIRVYKVGGSGLGERVEGGRNQGRFD